MRFYQNVIRIEGLTFISQEQARSKTVLQERSEQNSVPEQSVPAGPGSGQQRPGEFMYSRLNCLKCEAG